MNEGIPQAKADIVRRVEAVLADADARAELRSHSYVLAEQRVLYVSTPRAACTTMKMLLLGALGLDLSALAASTIARTSPETLIHDRERFPTPSLADLDVSERSRALTEAGWLRFCVVRNPYARLYSAWEDKLLLGDPARPGRFGAPGAYDVVDEAGGLDVRRSFAAFVSDLARRPSYLLSDAHFRPQHAVVWAADLPYDEVVRLEQLPAFVSRLRAHVVAQGGCDPGDPPQRNSGLGVDWRRVYDETTAARARELYADDFERWGYDTWLPLSEDPVSSLPPIAFRLVQRVRTMNEGLAVLSTLASGAEAATSERDVERAGRLRVERHAEQLASAHSQLVERYEQLAAEHAQLVGRHAQLEGDRVRIAAQLDASDARWRALEARRSVRLLRRLQRTKRRLRRTP
ncbi:MAG: sulfotransferase family 2 domain-containing protein [Conexibacter sp.]